MGVAGTIVSLGSIRKTKSIHTNIYLRTYLAEFSFNYQIYKYNTIYVQPYELLGPQNGVQTFGESKNLTLEVKANFEEEPTRRLIMKVPLSLA